MSVRASVICDISQHVNFPAIYVVSQFIHPSIRPFVCLSIQQSTTAVIHAVANDNNISFFGTLSLHPSTIRCHIRTADAVVVVAATKNVDGKINLNFMYSVSGNRITSEISDRRQMDGRTVRFAIIVADVTAFFLLSCVSEMSVKNVVVRI